MKILNTLAFAGAMAVMAGTSYAATVDTTHNGTQGTNITYTLNGATTNSSGGKFSMTGTNNTTGIDSLTGSFAAFCVDLATYIQSPAKYAVDTSIAASVVTSVTNLFNAAYQTVLDNNDNTTSAAFQIALWKTVYGGAFSSNTHSVQVNNFLTSAANYSGPQLWEVTFLDGHGNNPASQNLVTADTYVAPVPLPAAGLLLLGGVGGLGIVARRRNKTA